MQVSMCQTFLGGTVQNFSWWRNFTMDRLHMRPSRQTSKKFNRSDYSTTRSRAACDRQPQNRTSQTSRWYDEPSVHLSYTVYRMNTSFVEIQGQCYTLKTHLKQNTVKAGQIFKSNPGMSQVTHPWQSVVVFIHTEALQCRWLIFHCLTKAFLLIFRFGYWRYVFRLRP